MQIQIVSKGIDVSPALSERIEGRIEDMMDKYIHRDSESHVVLSKDGSGFQCVIHCHLPSSATMQAHGSAPDAYAAAEEALDHLEKQLRRYNRRLKDHQAEQKSEALAMFVLQNPVNDENDESEFDTPPEPLVIAEKKTEIRTMTVSMASLELGLAGNGAVVFHNAAHGGLNVVFKRADGNIGWIDPQR